MQCTKLNCAWNVRAVGVRFLEHLRLPNGPEQLEVTVLAPKYCFECFHNLSYLFSCAGRCFLCALLLCLLPRPKWWIQRYNRNRSRNVNFLAIDVYFSFVLNIYLFIIFYFKYYYNFTSYLLKYNYVIVAIKSLNKPRLLSLANTMYINSAQR